MLESVLTTPSETRTAKVLGDPLVEMTDADRQTLYKTLVTLTDLQRTSNTAAETAIKLDEQMTSISTSLKSHATVPPAVATAVSDMTKRVTDLRTSIAGRPGQGFGDHERARQAGSGFAERFGAKVPRHAMHARALRILEAAHDVA